MYLTSKVIKGFNRGKEIGFPTANLLIDRSYTVPAGVFAS